MTRYGVNPNSTMTHLNGHQMCVVDVETTGLDPQKHDVIQLAVLPLGADLKPIQTIMPFYVNMRCKRPENADRAALKANHLDLAQIQLTGLDPWKCVDMFEEWFGRLQLPVGKKIVPLAHNWIFDHQFVQEWLGGPLSFNHFFDFHYRDSMVAAEYLNDRADFHVEKYPYPKVSLDYLCTVLGVTNVKAHDALADCVATAECYRLMCLQHVM